MSAREHRGEANDPTLVELEGMVRAAGGYVRPSDDLRPRTLDAAGDRRVRRRGRRMVALVAVLFLLMPALHNVIRSAWAGQSSAVVSSEDLHRRARELSLQGGVDASWSLFEAFRLMRRDQAARFAGDEPAAPAR